MPHHYYDDTQLNEIPFMYSQSAAFSALPVDQQRALIIQFTNMTGGRPTDSNAFASFINQQLGIGQPVGLQSEEGVFSGPPPVSGLDLSGIPVGGSTPFYQEQYGPQGYIPNVATAQAAQNVYDDVMIDTTRQSLNPDLIFNPEIGTYTSRTGTDIIRDRESFYNPNLFNPNAEIPVNREISAAFTDYDDPMFDSATGIEFPRAMKLGAAPFTGKARASEMEQFYEYLDRQGGLSDINLKDSRVVDFQRGNVVIPDNYINTNSNAFRELANFVTNNPNLSSIQVNNIIEGYVNRQFSPIKIDENLTEYQIKLRQDTQQKQINNIIADVTSNLKNLGVTPARLVSEADIIKGKTLTETPESTGATDATIGVSGTGTTGVNVGGFTSADIEQSASEFDAEGVTPDRVIENIEQQDQIEVNLANTEFQRMERGQGGVIPPGFQFRNGKIVKVKPDGRVIEPTVPAAPKISTEAGTAKAQQDSAVTPVTPVTPVAPVAPVTPTTPAVPQISGEPTDLQAEEGVFATQPIPPVSSATGITGAGTVANIPSMYEGGLGSTGAMTGLGQQAYDLSLEPADAFRRYRSRQMGEVPIGVLAGANLYGGYQPAYGRYLLNQASGNLPMVTGMGTQGGGFGEYLQSGQRRGLEDIRSSFGGLQNYLTSLGGQTLSDPQYAATFGLAPRRDEIVSASLAALGNRALGDRGTGNLRNIFDMYQTQYGPQGASRFADFIGTAFNPVAMGGM